MPSTGVLHESKRRHCHSEVGHTEQAVCAAIEYFLWPDGITHSWCSYPVPVFGSLGSKEVCGDSSSVQSQTSLGGTTSLETGN